MFKLIIFALGLAIGCGGGMYYATKHPEDAQRRVLEAELEVTRRVKDRLDQIAAKRAQGTTPAAGFAAGMDDTKRVLDPDVASLRDEQERKQKELEARLASMKK